MSEIRINLIIKGERAKAAEQMKNKGLVASHAELVRRGILALQQQMVRHDLDKVRANKKRNW